jgi:hypothetical protein
MFCVTQFPFDHLLLTKDVTFMCKDKPKLVDIPALRGLVEKLELKDETKKDFIKNRWLKYVEWWDHRAQFAKIRFHWLQGAVVVASAAVPALIALRELKFVGESNGLWLSVGAIVASLIVATFSGLERLFGFGDIWREKRKAAEIIKSEGFSFFELCGSYADFKTHEEAFKQFAENVEKLIRAEIHEYIEAVGAKPATNGDPGRK